MPQFEGHDIQQSIYRHRTQAVGVEWINAYICSRHTTTDADLWRQQQRRRRIKNQRHRQRSAGRPSIYNVRIDCRPTWGLHRRRQSTSTTGRHQHPRPPHSRYSRRPGRQGDRAAPWQIRSLIASVPCDSSRGKAVPLNEGKRGRPQPRQWRRRSAAAICLTTQISCVHLPPTAPVVPWRLFLNEARCLQFDRWDGTNCHASIQNDCYFEPLLCGSRFTLSILIDRLSSWALYLTQK